MPKDGRRSGWDCATRAAALALLLAAAGTCWGAAPAAPDKAGLFDLNASGGDIKSVLEALARQTGVNIVVSPELAGEVNAQLKQMSLDDILAYLAAAQGFSWKKTGDAYVVTSKGAAEPSKTEQEPPPAPAPAAPEMLVWECAHIDPATVIPLVEKLFPAIKIAEGPDSLSPKLGTASSSLSYGASAGSTSDSATTRRTSTKVALIGEAADIARARELLAKLDVKRPQISIDVTIAELSAGGVKDLGIDWNWNDVVLAEATPTGGVRFGKFTKQGMTFTGALSDKVTRDDTNLLSKPNVSVVDGECADILIGDRILYPKLVGYTQFGTPMYDKAEEKVGIYLQIAPRVAGEDEILLTLYPQVSLITGYLKTQAGDYPQISTREARTTVRIKNGSTLAIGGLLREDEIRNASKIPLLGDLPIIGQLFRHTKKTKARTEIVILLTPKIVKENQPAWQPTPP